MGTVSSSMSGPSPRRWRRDERTLWRVGPGSVVVVLGPHDATPRSLRDTGAALWAALDRPRSVHEVAARLAAEFDADPDVVRRDVEPVVAQLVETGALRAFP